MRPDHSLEDLADKVDSERSYGIVSTALRRTEKLVRRTEVQENSGGDSTLDCEGSIGLKGADLLLGLLRGGDCEGQLTIQYRDRQQTYILRTFCLCIK